ncbi:MAG: RNA-binding S4 domain-containing protein [Pseudomonadales bacterium]
MSDGTAPASGAGARVRLDRWLWAARFFRTRAQAKSAIEGGKVHVAPPRGGAGAAAFDNTRDFAKPKPSKEIGVGDVLEIRRGETSQVVEVMGVSEQRGSAPVAQALYRETAASIEARETERARRMMQRAGLRVPVQRPSKRDRREIKKLKQGNDDTENS